MGTETRNRPTSRLQSCHALHDGFRRLLTVGNNHAACCILDTGNACSPVNCLAIKCDRERVPAP
eukprot:4742934-Lingulodinium_polyedra.AAC.1